MAKALFAAGTTGKDCGQSFNNNESSNFGKLTFTNCYADNKPLNAYADLIKTVMATANGTTKAQPSDFLNANGDYSVQWENAGP